MDRLILSLAGAMIALCAATWMAIASRHRAGGPVVPLTPRRAVPWRAFDLLMIALFYILANRAFWTVFSLLASIGASADRPLLPRNQAGGLVTPDELAVRLMASLVANLTASGFALLWIFSHTDATWEDLGWRRGTVRGDLRLGLIAFAAIAAPIYALQALLSRFTSEQHPIIEVLQRHPDPTLYVLAGLSAVLVAPFAEEFLIRVLLQGWLESAGTMSRSPAAESIEWRAIVLTSLFFSLLHLGHGAAPIPLFFLALVLGYLYQRTHRLLPSMTVHFCLNACSFFLLFASPPAAG
jgi:membrane protease YdiL (CAAX protease family)